jgi:ATP-dependent DNA helicase RecQ
LADTISETLALFRQGYSVDKIAGLRKLKPPTVYLHLSHALEQGAVELTDVVRLTAKEISLIQDAMLQLPEEHENVLKLVYDTLGGAYEYGVLSCVKAALQKEIASQVKG